MGYDVRIDGPETRAVLDLRGEHAALAAALADTTAPAWPERPNSLTRRDGFALAHIGSDHWLLIAELRDEPALLAALPTDEPPDQAGILCISDSLAFFTLSGRDAGHVLAVASPLDLHPSVFAQDSASYTEAFGVKALVLRDGAGFVLAVDRSFGDYVGEYLRRTAG